MGDTRVALAQINPTVGDLEGNIKIIVRSIEDAIESRVDLVVFPELALTGYPPQDLVLDERFVRNNKLMLDRVAKACREIYAIVGFVDHNNGRIYNAAALLMDGKVLGTAYKTLLPNYDVFNEDRYFEPADEIAPLEVELEGRRMNAGVEICEDLWDEKYRVKVTKKLVEEGANFIVNLSASPFYVGKRFDREQLLKTHAQANHVPIFYTNMVGGQDELVFDGLSMAVDSEGKLIAIGRHLEEDLVIVDVDMDNGSGREVKPPPYNKEEEIFEALVLGTKDYCRKSGFTKAVLGLSGGIDSSLVATIAAGALGKDNVLGISMPSQYSSEHSMADARELAENLGIKYLVIPIQKAFEAFKETLAEMFRGMEEDVTEENLQARIRGIILMAISNKLGYIVFTTGNKTELALGYCTLYGDMAGGLGVISDLSKTQVYKLAEYVNKSKGREIIPKRVFEKKPSAELREDQYDPFDYGVVSPLVDEIVENRRGREELFALGYKLELVDEILEKIRNAEYKRRQSPPGIKITRKAFGIGRKMPIVNKYV